MSSDSVINKFLQHFDRVLKSVSLIAGGLTLACMTVLSVWNVLIMRKLMNAPIIGAEDVMILLLVVIIALSVPLGARGAAHIEIEVLEPYMPDWFAKWSMIFVKLVSCALLCVMAWRLWHTGQSAVRFGETTRQLLISYEPFYYLLSVSIGLYAFVLLLDVWQIFRLGRVIPVKFDGDGQ